MRHTRHLLGAHLEFSAVYIVYIVYLFISFIRKKHADSRKGNCDREPEGVILFALREPEDHKEVELVGNTSPETHTAIECIALVEGKARNPYTGRVQCKESIHWSRAM